MTGHGMIWVFGTSQSLRPSMNTTSCSMTVNGSPRPFPKGRSGKKGSWLSGASFEWNAALPNGDVAQYVVYVEDEGFDSRKKVDYRSTRIRIEVLVSPSLEAIEEEEDWAMDLAVAAKTEQLRKNPPTEKFLGSPFTREQSSARS